MGSVLYDRLWPPILVDDFRYAGSGGLPGSASLPDTWTAASGIWNTSNERELQITTAGELVYAGTRLKNLSRYQNAVNFTIGVRTFGRPNMKFELRGRRIDASNYVSLFVDFENNILELRKNVAGTITTLQTESHTLDSDGINYYSFELWMHENNLVGCVNYTSIIDTVDSAHNTEDGASISVPQINSSDPITFAKFAAHDLIDFSPRLLEDDPSNLYVLFRKLMKEEIENPSEKNWTTYERAKKLWDEYKDIGRHNDHWRLNGYPIREPSTEDFFKNT